MSSSCPQFGFSVTFLFMLCFGLRLTTASFSVNTVGNTQRQHPYLLRCKQLSRYHVLGVCWEATENEISNTKEQIDSSSDNTFPKTRSARKTSNGTRGVKGTANALEATGSRKKRKKCKTPQVPLYWRNETDLFIVQDQDLMNVTCMKDAHLVQFQVRGNPRPLRRHRTAKGFMYNPSFTYQQSFRKVVEDIVKGDSPLFVEEHQLAMRIIFYMKRPKNHFIGSQPGPGRLKPAAPPRLAPSRMDIDNLAKFVLDSLNGLLYVDDRQVVSIFATKIFDNDGHCEGCTEVSIQRLTEDHVDDLLRRRLAPYSPM